MNRITPIVAVVAVAGCLAWPVHAEDRKGDAGRRKEEAARAAGKRKREATEKLRWKIDKGGFQLHHEGERAYRRGQELLDAGRWDKAVEAFDEVVAKAAQPPAPPVPPAAAKPPMPPVHVKPRFHLSEEGPRRVDGALYWKAYALHKLGKRSDALETIDTLRREHPQSGWLVQAKMLEAEVRQASGQPPSPESETDDELKLIALNALAKTHPERAVPLLEKILTGPATPGLQERALFVLSQSGSPQAREITARIARGSSNPDLQMRAVRNLAAIGGRESHDALAQAYRQSPDFEVKKVILQSLSAAGAHDHVAALVESEREPELLAAAMRSLLAAGGKHSEGGAATDDRLAALYGDRTEPKVRREIIAVLAERGNAGALVAIARKEKDPQLKKDIVHRLSQMKNKEATDYLLEILEK